jgi:hypothetical protein
MNLPKQIISSTENVNHVQPILLIFTNTAKAIAIFKRQNLLKIQLYLYHGWIHTDFNSLPISEDFDLINMGHCRYKKIYKFLHDSVAEEVLRYVKCPVMVTATDCPDKQASCQDM